MASNSRNQIESWLRTIDVKGSVIDVGGLFMPVKGRTKSWDVSKYVITDIKDGRKGVKTNFVWDFNYPLPAYDEYDNIFCLEVTDHFWNPYQAFRNMALLAKPKAMLYLSSNFLFPHHTGADYIRFTIDGLKKVLHESGFKIVAAKPRLAKNPTALAEVMKAESKVCYSPGEIGYMITAQRNG